MNYWEALEATVTLDEALDELRKHGVRAELADGRLIDSDGELVAVADEDGEFSGEDIVGYLGY
jgi:hypothetical protein